MSLFIIIDDTKVDVTTLTTARILELYNQLAFELGKPEVKRFSSRTTGESRLVGIADAAREARKGKGLLNETDQRQVKQEAEMRKAEQKPAPAPTPKPTPAPTAPVAAGAPRWARPKKEPAAKIAYKPRPGSSQAIMYDALTQPGGIDIEQFCEAMKAAGIKDKTLHSPPSVWSCLRYLFVTSKGYGLTFDGRNIGLVVPKDERDPNGSKKA